MAGTKEAKYPREAATERQTRVQEDEKGMRSDREIGSAVLRHEIQLQNPEPIVEQTCLICCENQTDAVLVPCSHGGLCYACAIRISQQSANCHFCRKVRISAFELVQRFIQIIKIEMADTSGTDFFKILDKYDVLPPQLTAPSLRQPHP